MLDMPHSYYNESRLDFRRNLCDASVSNTTVFQWVNSFEHLAQFQAARQRAEYKY